VGVHVVAGPGLAGPAVPATVVGDAAVAATAEEQHLVLPGVGAQRPAVTEDDGLSRAPVLVVDLRAVLRLDGVHGALSLNRARRRRLGLVATGDFGQSRGGGETRGADQDVASGQAWLGRGRIVHGTLSHA